MESVQTVKETATIHVENIGGIDETTVEFRPGVNILTGWNASNRTSLLQAIMAVLGSNRASLKGDADQAHVELDFGEETYYRTIKRRNGDIVFDGDPYTADPTLADLFAFLLESNDARRAVAQGENLREIIMRPVDTAAINAEIDALESKKREIETALEQRDQLAAELTELNETRENLTEQIEDKEAQVAAKREELEEADTALEESRERKAELESKLAELQETRSALKDVRFQITTEQETIDGIRTDLADVKTALADHPETPSEEIESIDNEIQTLRDRKRTLDTKINQLQSFIQFNEDLVNGEDLSTLDVLGVEGGSADAVTHRLLQEGDTFVCWTCGKETTRADIETALEALRESRMNLVGERGEITEKLDQLTDKRDALEAQSQNRAELKHRKAELTGELAEAEEKIESLEAKKHGLEATVESIEEEVESVQEDEYEEIVALHKAANELELELERLQSKRKEIDDRIQGLSDEVTALDERESTLNEIQRQLEEARTRIERLEDKAVEKFNHHMEAVLEVLEYGNIERIWLERVERDVRDGRRKIRRGFFELHVVRSNESGSVYEDTVGHLSESEREVTGLVFALAGYLVHEVHDALPFMLLDSIEAIDSNRIAALVEYLAEHAEYLVVALLPDDAEALDDRHHRITEI